MMLFTPGRILFTIIFVVVFVAVLVWSYRKDLSKMRGQYRRSYLVLVGLLTFVTILFLIVKLRKIL
jgi:cbb3-type cytochrome oxidase subunit 3